MSNNYYDALEYEVTRAEARREIALHDADWWQFLEEVGDKEEYMGYEVLDWLGY